MRFAVIGLFLSGTAPALAQPLKFGQNRLADRPEMPAAHEDVDADRRSIAAWMKRLGYWSCT